MYRSGLRTDLLLAGVLLACCGCQTEELRSSPGALPGGLRSDATPRLNASTYFAHGHLLERQGNHEQAVQQYHQALELSPDFPSARNRLGITLNKLGRHAAATAEFRRALEKDPAAAHLHNNLGFSLYLEGRYAEADESLRRALELQPDYPRARMNRGVVLARLGDYEQALGELTLATGEADAHYNLGVIQTAAGDLAAAARSLETALRLDPRLEAARQQLHVVARLAAEAEAATGAEPAFAQDSPEAEPPTVALVADTDANPPPEPSATPSPAAATDAPPEEPGPRVVADANVQQNERERLIAEIIRRMVALGSES